MKLKTIMQDRPDLIESELSGLAFDSLQQIFKTVHLDVMFSQECPAILLNDDIHLIIDPAAGGPHSDYAMVSIQRNKGLVTVGFCFYYGYCVSSPNSFPARCRSGRRPRCPRFSPRQAGASRAARRRIYRPSRGRSPFALVSRRSCRVPAGGGFSRPGGVWD